MLLRAPANVFIEISGITLVPKEAGAFFVPIWRKFGMGRILLGSDWPTMNLNPAKHLEWLKSYPLTQEERRAIVYENALKLFPVE
jgi:predicted TIM-barrel fold metal-dependent hydrolase